MVDTHLMATHWFEIEKHFDFLAGANTNRSMEIITKLDLFSKGNEKIDAHVKQLISDEIDAFHLYRTISAVARQARKECEQREKSA